MTNFKEYTVQVYNNGDQFWYLDGELHREDGPAVIKTNGYKAYYLNGKLHREDGPAVIKLHGYKSYYLNGKLHREDGPAVVYSNGYKAYYINGKEYSKEKYYKELYKPEVKELTVDQISDILGYEVKIVGVKENE